jgi:hypothetical protein
MGLAVDVSAGVACEAAAAAAATAAAASLQILQDLQLRQAAAATVLYQNGACQMAVCWQCLCKAWHVGAAWKKSQAAADDATGSTV